MKILSANQLRAWDEYTIANEPVSSLDLMERAAVACTDWIAEHVAKTKQVKIFCGKGNNGGDGLAIARLLAGHQYRVDVYILEFGNVGTEDFQSNLSMLHSCPVGLHFIQEKGFLPLLNTNDLVIDALLGTGVNRPLEGLFADTVQHLNSSGSTIVSIDLPTGLLADQSTTGEVVKAAHTLTFQQLKLCFLLPENERYTGRVSVLDIGLSKDFYANVDSIYHLTNADTARRIYKPRNNFSHKGIFGHALIIAGSKGKMGAAVLSTKACLRSGAGLVTAAVPQDEFDIIQAAAPEAMALSAEDLKEIDLSKYTAIGIGPGIGTAMAGMQLVHTVLSQTNKPLVADADALNLLASNPTMLSELPPGSIITPHPKEFERLFGASQNDMSRLQIARYHAKKLFLYIVLKGHYTAIACPDGMVYFNTTGNPGMATGGSGDVLTGIITGLLAQGYSSKDASMLGVYIHGMAGDIAASRISQEAMLAGDLIKYLGKAFLQLKDSFAPNK